MAAIPMVDLHQQYLHLKDEVDCAIQNCLTSAHFISGNTVTDFEIHLAEYLQCGHVISCANGTDALQLALMASDLPKGSKIIVPAFTYIAPVEVIRLLGYEIVYADVDLNTFNITPESIAAVYTDDVKAIIVVHLFGQTCDIQTIDAFAQQKKLLLIEDYAQSLGAEKRLNRNSIITTSFFPSKNLGAYGDGGAVMTNDALLAKKIRCIANHGQFKKYEHEIIGINSRLDTIQAAILSVKLSYLDSFISKRQEVAAYYNEQLKEITSLHTPLRAGYSAHTFHQYTIKTEPEIRNRLRDFLIAKEISTAVYYPMPCYRQKAYSQENLYLPNAESLCHSVLSIPIFPEITQTQLSYICNSIQEFFHINE